MEHGTPTDEEKRLVERMSHGKRAKIVSEALEHSSLVWDILELNDRERAYLGDILALDRLGWDLTKAGESGPGGVPLWEATHRSDGTQIEAPSRSGLVKRARISN